MNVEAIRKLALEDIVKDVKVLAGLCYNETKDTDDCKDCKNFGICSILFGAKTPQNIAEKVRRINLKEESK